MARVSKEEKARSRDRILEAASVIIRRNGIETASLAEIMHAAGMTHGGFYRHFSNKDELVAAAFAHAVGSAVNELENATGPEDQRSAKGAYIDNYLSARHVKSPDIGCPIAALGSDFGRASDTCRDESTAAIERVAGLLDDGRVGANGYAQLALLVGAITLARMSDDETQVDTILQEARHALTSLDPAQTN